MNTKIQSVVKRGSIFSVDLFKRDDLTGIGLMRDAERKLNDGLDKIEKKSGKM